MYENAILAQRCRRSRREGDPFDPDTDDDGIIDGLDRDPDSTSNNLCFGQGDVATLNASIANMITCAAIERIDVIPSAGITATGDLRLISPEISIDAGESGMNAISVDPGGKLETISTNPMAPIPNPSP